MIQRLLAAAVVVASLSSLAVEPVALTEDEFKMAQHYKNALTDSRVQAMKPEARPAAIAKDGGFKVKDLNAAVAKAEAAGDVKSKCEANLKELLGTGELAGRTGRLEVDTSGVQAVTYVQWFNEEPKNLPIEAAFAAARAVEACPVASTFVVWAQDKSAPKVRVFQALASNGSAKRINVDKVKDFAETRYIKLFEKVKNAANGDDLSAENGTPAAAP